MVNFITVYFQGVLNFLNKVIKKFPFFRNLVFYFVDTSSWFIGKFLFDIRLYIPFIVITLCYSLFISKFIDSFFILLDNIGFSLSNIILACKQTLPLHFIIFIFVIFIFLEMILLTMLLIRVPCVNEYMVNKYGANIFKERGLNGPFSALSRAVGAPVAILTAYIVHSAAELIRLGIDSNSRQAAIRALMDSPRGGEVEIKSPSGTLVIRIPPQIPSAVEMEPIVKDGQIVLPKNSTGDLF